MKYLKLSVTTILICTAVQTLAQSGSELGVPEIVNYTVKTVSDAQIWTITQDKRGFMYFGTSQDIVRYDGSRWQSFYFGSNNASNAIRALKTDSSGRVFYGSMGDFGYLLRDSAGHVKKVSLRDLVPKEYRNFQDIRTIQITPAGNYYHSRLFLFRVAPDNSVKTWIPKTSFMYTFFIDNELYVHEQNHGLLKLTGDSLVLIPGSEILGKERMQLMLPFIDVKGTKKFLIGLFNQGLYLFDGKSFEKFKTEADPFITEYSVYASLGLPDNTYALGTIGAGIIIIDRSGKIVQHVTKKSGLPDDLVYSIFLDKSNNLWMGHDVGISKLKLNNPYTYFRSLQGVSSAPLVVKRFNGELYAGSSAGLLKLNAQKREFELFKEIAGNQIFDLLVDGNRLLVPNDGLIALKNNKIKIIKPSVGGDFAITGLMIPQQNRNLLLTASSGGFAVFYRDSTKPGTEWEFIGRMPDIKEAVWTFSEDSRRPGELWAGTQSNITYRVDFPLKGKPGISDFKAQRYDSINSNYHLPGYVLTLDGKTIFPGDSSFFRFNYDTGKFYEDTVLGKFPGGGGNIESFAAIDRSGRIWLRVGRKTRILTPSGNGFSVDSTSLEPLSQLSLSQIYHDKDSIAWFASPDGVIRYDAKLASDSTKSFPVILNYVFNGKTSINPEFNTNNNAPVHFPYKNNSLRFEYTAPYYDNESMTEYQTMLVGYEDDWSLPGNSNYKEYTNLPSGRYTFRVRAQNIYGKFSEEDSYTFIIATPWYSTWWAWLLYVTAAVAIISLIVRNRTKHLHDKQKELEGLIKERTFQLSQRAEELAVINSVQESLVREKDMDAIYKIVGEKIREIFNAQVIDIVTYDSKTKFIEDRYSFEKGDTTLLGSRPLQGFRKPVVERAEVLLINTAVADKALIEKHVVLQGELPKSLLIVPMISNGKVTGMISLQDLDKENAFSEYDVHLLTTLSNSMSVALESASRFDETKRLLKETEQRNAELGVINSVQEGLVSEMNMQGIFDLVGEKIREIFNAQVIDIVMYDKDTNLIEDRYAYEKGDPTLLGPRAPHGFRIEVLEKRDTIVINSGVEEKARKMNSGALIGDVPKSLVIVPMISNANVTGMISLQDLDKENAFTDSDVSLLKTLANSMSVALESARRFDETKHLLKETEQRNAELAVINSVQDGLVREMNMQGIFDLVGEKIREIFNAQVIDIVMYDKDTDLIEDRYAYEKGDRSLIGPRPPSGFRKHIIQSLQPLFINTNFEEVAKKYNNEIIFGEAPKSAALMPLIAGNEVKGIISLQNLDRENAFSESDHSLLTTLSNSMSVALESARLFDETTRLLNETEQRNAELAVINSVQEGLVAQLNIQSIYDLVGEKIREIFNAQVIDIVTYDARKNTIEDRYAYEKGDRTMIGPREPMGFRKHVIETRQLLLHNDRVDEETLKFGNPLLIGERPKSQVFVPMIAGGEIKGIISLQNLDREHAFRESDVRLLTTLANSMSVALENARLFDETKRLLLETEQRTAELGVINIVQEGLVREIDANAIYNLVGEKMREIFNAQVIDIVTYDKNTNIIEDRYAYEKGDRSILPPREPYGYRKHVIDTKQMLLLNSDTEKHAEFYGNKVIVGEMTKSVVFVPLLEGNEVKGIVSLQNIDQENAFSDSDVRLLVTLANSLSIALQNAKLFDETKRLLKETEQRTAELAVINTVQEGLVREMNAESIYEMVGEKMREVFNAQVVDIVTYDKNANIIEDRYAFEKGDRTRLPPRQPYGIRKHIIESKQLMLINHSMRDYEVKFENPIYAGQGAQSAIFVPLLEGNEVTGIVSLQNLDEENAFSDSNVKMLVTLSSSLSIALQNARLFDETNRLLAEAKQRTSELSTVNNVSKTLASQLNPDELIERVGVQMKELFNANIVYVALLNDKTKMIYFPYQAGDNLVPMKLGEGLTSQILITGEPLLLNSESAGVTTTLGFQRVGIPAASYLGVPIPDGDKIIGVVSVQSTEQENRFDENDQRLLSTIAASVGVALRNARLFEEVQLAKLEAETATKIAEKANEAKSAFLSTVSHELRTPLTSVLGFAKIIRKRLEERIFPHTNQSDPKTVKVIQQVSENLSVVVAEGERLTHLINDVLDLAKIEAGKMEWNEEWVSIPEIVERASSATSALFDQKNLQIEKIFTPDLPDIRGDKDKLIQVVVNLLSNAVKFTDQGKVTCKVTRNRDEIIVDIIDTGIGIAESDHNAVFEQFRQVGDTLTDKPKGTGLGLPICKEIVEHHGGHIWLESEPGKGSTFSFSIPLVVSEDVKPLPLNDLVAQLKEQMAQSRLNNKTQSSTILIVDDDDSIRSLLYQELSDAGYLIEEATNGKEALVKIRANRPDLIILDVMMPEMNGFDVAAVLKNDPQTMDIPIIVLSIVQDKARGYRIGVDRYLTKPIDTGVLFSEVDSLLQQGKSRKKVMVVDEDQNTVKTLVDVLKRKGYQVVESDGKEMVAKALDAQPDIIILNSLLSEKMDLAQSLRLEKGMENVLFLVYQ